MSKSQPSNLLAEPLLLPQWINSFIVSSSDDCSRITCSPNYRSIIQTNCLDLADLAYEQNVPEALLALHNCLHIIYATKFSVPPAARVDADIQPVLTDISGILEREMLNQEYEWIDKNQISDYPTTGEAYLKWLKKLIAEHPANAHPFYRDFLRNHATAADIRFFLAQETNLDPRFDDILALLQVGIKGRAKMEIASNYWDEMGNGNPEQVHTFMFDEALRCLNVDPSYIQEHMLIEARISGNLSMGLALNKRHQFKAIGYFGVTEYITPARFKNLVKAWQRNGLPEEGITYHNLHVTIDTIHGNSWFNNVIAPTIDHTPALGKEIALGALVRLNSSTRYLDAMLKHLQGNELDVLEDTQVDRAIYRVG